MDEITKEIEVMAEQMEKSVQTKEFSLDLIKSTVIKLGPEGLKKAAAKLTPEQKELLKGVLEDMKKSHKDSTPNKQESLEPQSNSTPDGDYKFNEDSKPPQLAQDEVLSEEARKRNQMEHRNQGGVPVEGWEGQVIKSEDIEKGGSGSGRKPLAPGQAGVESLKNLRARAEESKEVQAKFQEGKEEAPAAPKSLEEKKKIAKGNVKAIMKKMQAGKIAKADACYKMAKSLGVDQGKLEQLWDLLAKGDVLPEKGNPEGSQSAVPSQMKGDEGAGVQGGEDPSVPKYKNGKAKNPAMDDSGTPKTTADGGEQPPKPLKKADNYFHDEGEPVYIAKSQANPFAVRTTGQNAAYAVDQFIENEANAQKERLSKSTFDYEDDAERLVKSDDPTEADVVNANAKKKADGKREEKQEIRQLKTDEKLSRIEGHSGPKMPFVKKMKKSVVDQLIEGKLDMDQTTVEVAQANRAAQASGGFLVKSFNDQDMDALFGEQDMFRKEKKA